MMAKKLHKQNIEGAIVDVQPLRTLEEIQDMKNSLRRWCSERDYMMFLIGINTGLRVSDIVSLTVEDLRGKDYALITELKTKKPRRVDLWGIRGDIEAYAKKMAGGDWMFPSRKGTGPITTTQAYRALVKAGEMIDRTDIGSHTMRKTFGYFHYKRNKDVAVLQSIFGHAAPSITLRYIGITQDEIDASLDGFRL